MKKFISFFSGFAIAVVCGSLLITEYEPVRTYIGSVLDESPLAHVQVPFEVQDEMAQVAAMIDGTKSHIVESVTAWDKIDLSYFLKSNLPQNRSVNINAVTDQEAVHAEIAEFALASGAVVEAVDYTPSSGWLVRLASGEKVILGEDSIGPRLRRVLAMVDRIPASEQRDSVLIDARYSNGVAVSNIESVVAMQ